MSVNALKKNANMSTAKNLWGTVLMDTNAI